MKVKLKICGMRDAQNVAEVAVLQPDYMGFIFYSKSPRFVGSDFELPATLSTVKRVGVFVNEQVSNIIRTVSEYQLDFVQLHGTETTKECEALKTAGVEVIKAFSMDEYFDFASVESYKNYVRYFLFDTKGKFHGGNAQTFDWDLLRKYDQSIPFFLSGGLTPENIHGVGKLNHLNIHALDVNSGVETAPAMKDVNKIKELKRVIDSW